jgi:hypothetical protein
MTVLIFLVKNFLPASLSTGKGILGTMFLFDSLIKEINSVRFDFT